MDEIKSNVSLRSLIQRYTLWYAVCAVICLLPFFLFAHRSFITFDDGLHQQYIYYLYVGKWIRKLFENLFVKHIFEIPMWDMSIGMGSDPLISVFGVTYPFADPFGWLFALIPLSATEIVFDLLILVRLYLAGVAFSAFAYNRKLTDKGILIGSLTYVFSAVITVGFRQVVFQSIFILFPLLLIGADRLWHGKGNRTYVIVLAIMTFYSPYFTYMSGLMLIIYCVMRFFAAKTGINTLGKLLVRFVGYSVAGIVIGIGPLMPGIINMTRLDRLSADVSYSLLSLSTMKEQFLYAFSYRNLWHESIWGFSSLIVIAAFLIFRERKDYLLLKILFVLSFVSFSVPFIGSMMNGFNYPANRYVYGFAFLSAYMVAVAIPEFGKLRGKSFIYLLVASFIYLFIAITGNTSAKLSAVSLIVVVLLIGLSNHFVTSEKLKYYCLMISAVLSCLCIGIATNSESSYEYIDYGTANDIFGSYAASDEYHTEKLRTDIIPYSYTDVPVNTSMITGRYGYDFYHSNYNNNVDHYYDDLAVVSNAMGFQQTGLRGRAFLEILNGTGVVLRQNDEDKVIRASYLFDRVSSAENYDIYTPTREASMVFFYDDAVSYESYAALTPYEREELMMAACVAEIPGNDTAEIDVSQHDVIIPESIEAVGCEYADNSVTVSGDSGYIVLSVPGIADNEISVFVDGLDHQGSYYFQFAAVLMHGDKAVAADFYAGIDQGFDYYHGKNTLLFNFGVIDDTVDEIRLYFNTPGEYSITDIELYTRTPEQLKSITDGFYDHADIDDISYDIDGNHISVNAVADKDKYLYLAIPYSEGWSATVDGEKAEIIRANEAFMAVRLSAGDHKIELSYKTPHILEGIMISALVISIFCIFERISGSVSKGGKKG